MLKQYPESTQTCMSLVSLEALVDQDYYLRRLDQVLDLRFVREAVQHLYSPDNGRPAVDPELIIRLFVLQAVERIPSVRQLMTNAAMHGGYRWFLRVPFDQPLPDHSTLSRAVARFGDEVFNALLQKSIAQCQQSGLIEGKLLHVDATTIRADLDKDRVGQPAPPDPDARYGRFPGNRKEPGYKQHTVADDQKRVILAVAVTPANVNEGTQFQEVVEQATQHLAGPPLALCADSAYASGENAAACESQGSVLLSPPPKPRNHHSDEQFTIEQFIYDEVRDEFICPHGKVLVKQGRYAGKKNRYKYRASARDCGVCPFKGQCTKAKQRCLNVSKDHGALVRLRQRSRNDLFKALYRRRAPVIEGLFAEAKQRHGLGRAWRRGLIKMRVQCLLIAAVMNFKRLMGIKPRLSAAAAVCRHVLRSRRPLTTLIEHLRAPLRRLLGQCALHYIHRVLLRATL